MLIVSRLKINPVSINEAVGQNLHDNMNMAVYVSIQKPISVTLGKVFSLSTVWKYLWTSSGKFVVIANDPRQDRKILGSRVRIPSCACFFINLDMLRALHRWTMNELLVCYSLSGHLSFPPVSGVEYNSRSSVMLFAMGTASERLLRDLSNYKPKV